jgi:hypothetical protein
MELTVYFDSVKNIVIAEPIAEVTTDNVRETIKQSLVISKEHNCDFLLFDTRKCYLGQSIIEGFEAMSKIGESIGMSPKYKYAIVYNPANYPEERAKFIENVVTNRLSNAFKFFANMEEAIMWLEKFRK